MPYWNSAVSVASRYGVSLILYIINAVSFHPISWH